MVVTAADGGTALVVDVPPGQARDAPYLVRILDRTLARVPVVGEVVGDKGLDGDRRREACLDRGVSPNIPLKADRDADRWSWYRERNRVERLFGEVKQFRRVATRHDELEATSLGLLHLAFGFIRLRAKTNVNAP